MISASLSAFLYSMVPIERSQCGEVCRCKTEREKEAGAFLLFLCGDSTRNVVAPLPSAPILRFQPVLQVRHALAWQRPAPGITLVMEIQMPDFFTPISDLCQNQLEASRRLSDALFYGTGKIDRVMLDAGHRAVDEQLRYAQAVGNMRDPQVFSNLQSVYWAAKPEQVRHFQQEFMRILAETQNELGRATQSLIEQFGMNALRSLPFAAPLPSAKAGMQDINPLGGLMAAWGSTMCGMSRLSEQALGAARSGFGNAAQAASTVDKSIYSSAVAATETLEAFGRQVWNEADESATPGNDGNGDNHPDQSPHRDPEEKLEKQPAGYRHK